MNSRQIKKFLEKIIAKYELRAEVDSWAEYFGKNPKRLSVWTLSTYVKAALTGKTTLRIGREKAIEVVHEINEVLPEREHMLF